MNCKKCIHWDKCSKTNGKTRYYGETIASDNVEELCEWFISTADVVPKSEADEIAEELSDTIVMKDELFDEVIKLRGELANAKSKLAREIFEEIEGSIAVHAFTSKSEDYANGMYDAIEWVDSKIAELKKKYTE